MLDSHNLVMLWVAWGAVVTQAGWQGALLLLGTGVKAFDRAHAFFDAAGVDLPGFHLLATLRMLAFVLAVLYTVPVTAVLGARCATPAARFVAGFFQCYAVLLVVSFCIIFKLKRMRKQARDAKIAKSA